jgi:small basic protein
MLYAVLGLVLGIGLGIYLPVFPQVYSKLVAVAFMASLDAGFGGLRAVKEGTYDSSVFISGFFANGIFAVFLCYFGMRLGIDLYYVALLAFGLRILIILPLSVDFL